jgi:cation transport ATPase
MRSLGVWSLRPSHASEAVVNAMRARGVAEIIMLMGGLSAVARRLSQLLKIEHYIAEALAERKAKVEWKPHAKGHTIIVVGGAIHASPVLAEEAVGMFVHI